MPTDPNAGLIKAIQSQTRSIDANTTELKEQNKLLKKLAGIGGPLRFQNHSYFERRDAEDSGGPAAPEPGVGGESEAGSSGR